MSEFISNRKAAKCYRECGDEQPIFLKELKMDGWMFIMENVTVPQKD